MYITLKEFNQLIKNMKLPNGAGFMDHEDVPTINVCDHQCTSQCRKTGCNCDCGEYHNEDGIYEEEDTTN